MSTQVTDVTRANGATVHREEFGASQLEVIQETAATAVAAREKAAVEARYIVAMKRPRSIERVRQQILETCKQKTFAATAWYKIPNRGEGFTIRFAEEALRAFGNVLPESAIVFENDRLRMFRVSVTDLESNITYSNEVIIEKTVERKATKSGQRILGERINSYGDKVFLIEATEEEITVKQNAALSKSLRTGGLRLIPSWIKEEAKTAIFVAMKSDVAEDFPAKRRKVVDWFAGRGITAQHLEEYLGRAIDQTTPEEIIGLKSVMTALQDGETTWADVMESREPIHEEKHGSREAAAKVAEEKLSKIRQEQDSPEAPAADETTAAESSKGPRGFNFGGKK